MTPVDPTILPLISAWGRTRENENKDPAAEAAALEALRQVQAERPAAFAAAVGYAYRFQGMNPLSEGVLESERSHPRQRQARVQTLEAVLAR